MIPPFNASLLISIVRRKRGERVVEIVRRVGAAGSTIMLARGTARNRLLQRLFLADTEKEVVFTIAPDEKMKDIISALKYAPDLCRKSPGIGFTVNVFSFLRSGPLLKQENLGETGNGRDIGMTADYTHQLICVIVNAGFADDLMHAARNAGARGGTIFHARGTASGQDSSFFGITIVPEKELLMVLANNAEAEPIASAVRAAPCMAEPGVGIIFRLPVMDFFPLGLKANQIADR